MSTTKTTRSTAKSSTTWQSGDSGLPHSATIDASPNTGHQHTAASLVAKQGATPFCTKMTAHTPVTLQSLRTLLQNARSPLALPAGLPTQTAHPVAMFTTPIHGML